MTNASEASSGSRLLAFFTLTFVWSWACWLLSSVIKQHLAILSMVLFLAGSFGPGIAAVAVVRYARGRDGLRRWLAGCLQWRVGWHWMLIAFLLPLLVMLSAVAAHVALGGTVGPSPASGQIPLAAANFILVLLIGGPLGEEFGWRGYALPVLQARAGWRIASLLLGLIWGAWHLPLFFIADTPQSQIPLALFLLSTLSLSVLFAWLFNRTEGSVLPVLVLHTAINAWPGVVPIMSDGGDLQTYGLAVGLLVCVALALLCDAGPPAPARLVRERSVSS